MGKGNKGKIRQAVRYPQKNALAGWDPVPNILQPALPPPPPKEEPKIDPDNREWFYHRAFWPGQHFEGPFSLRELQELLDFGRLQQNDVIRRGGPENPVLPSSRAYGLSLRITPTSASFNSSRKDGSVTVLAGANNSGKSLLLKELSGLTGPDAYLLTVNRFHQFYGLGHGNNDRDSEKFNQYNNLVNSNIQLMNVEHSFMQPNLSNLSNVARGRLLSVCGEILGVKLSIRRASLENDLSQSFLEVDGKSARFLSTGVRMIITVFAAIFDARFSTILVDEPELGLNPGVQLAVARLLFDPEMRRKEFPHLKRLFIATHSHLFLDRKDHSNNFLIVKQSDEISIRNVSTMAQFHQVQFDMLGNDLESLYLPSAIVVLEGPSDFEFITKVVQMKWPERRISIVNGRNDDGIVDRVNEFVTMLGNRNEHPYRTRIITLFDQVRGAGLKDRLTKLGIPDTQIIVLSKNGIEHYYPVAEMCEIYKCAPETIAALDITGDNVTVGGITHKKTDLAKLISAKLMRESVYNEEFTKLIDMIEKVSAPPF